MATTDRQNRLLVAEDWRKIYQAFQQADFKSYDFETLRRTMVAYLRENYPDDFNDFVESSEYVALIDLIAYVAQALSFRVDLNARENFLETAERRNSVLRLARLISYNAKRNLPATGLLKVDAISTTQDVSDSTGNKAREAIRTVIVEVPDPSTLDRIRPVIFLHGRSVLELQVGQPFVEPGYQANDNVDGNIADAVIVDGADFDSNVIGTYNITYNVSDIAGNAAKQKVRTVTVAEPPAVILISPITPKILSLKLNKSASLAHPIVSPSTNKILLENVAAPELLKVKTFVALLVNIKESELCT